MLPPLTDTEKAYFDSIKQVAQGTRPRDLSLFRMELDGKPVAVVSQRVISRDNAETAGWQPLAIICDEETTLRLRNVSGEPAFPVDATDVEGAG